MRWSSLRGGGRIRSLRSHILLAVLSAAAIVVGLRVGLFAPLADLGRSVLAPFERRLVRGGERVFGILYSLARSAQLTERLRALQDEVAKRQAAEARALALTDELARVRADLGLLPRERFALVSADVIGPTTDGLTSAFRINRGARDGVSAGAPVILSGDIVVGRVTDVTARTATADLLTSERVRVTARDTATGAEGIIRGSRRLGVLLESVPRTMELHPGDLLVTSGRDGIFPEGLLVGAVESVRARENAIFQEATVELARPPESLRAVAVIIRHD